MTNQPVICPACGSFSITLMYQTPVYVDLGAGRRVERVVVADEDAGFQGQAFCNEAACGARFELDEEPETLDWPAWELGF